MQLPVTVGDRVEMRDTSIIQDVICRAGTYDDFVAREIRGTYGWMDVQGRRVLDIGGNIGAYARWAIAHGAVAVTTVEPEESNYRCLTENVRLRENEVGCAVHAIRALVGVTEGTGEIWLSPTGKNPGNTSSVRYRGRVAQEGIPIVPFATLLEQHRPDVLKIDVEGAEYDFFHTAQLPDSVTQVTMEIHLSRPDWRAHSGPAIVASFADWECVTAPKFEGGHWQTIGAWRR